MTRKYGFRITEPNGRFSPLRLYASTAGECRSWVESLKRAGGMVAIIEKYTVCEIIGRGKFSVVKRAISKSNGKQLAVKIIDKKALNPKELEFLRTELQILKVVRHPNLVHIYDITEFRERVYIFMEYMSFGELNRYIRKRTESLPSQEIALIVRETVKTLTYLHMCGVIHRDLKPDNILVIPNEQTKQLDGLRIVDFGLSKLMKPNQKVVDACGTLSYVAPEVLQKNGYNEKVDIWSVGVVMYLLFRGQLPFDGKNKREMINQIMDAPVRMNHRLWKNVGNQEKDLIYQMMLRDVGRRLSAEEVLQHPFIKQTDNFIDKGEDQFFMNQADLSKHTHQSIEDTSSDGENLADTIVSPTINVEAPSPLPKYQEFEKDSTLRDEYHREYETERTNQLNVNIIVADSEMDDDGILTPDTSRYDLDRVHTIKNLPEFLPTHLHADMLASKKRDDIFVGGMDYYSPRKPRVSRSVSVQFNHKENQRDVQDEELDEQEIDEFSKFLTYRHQDVSGTIQDSARTTEKLEIHINSIRLAYRRSPGSYLSGRKGGFSENKRLKTIMSGY